MSKLVHPLFLTRGVPGTHDSKMLYNIITQLLKEKFKSLKISDVYKNDKFRLYSIGRYTIAELQELADTYDIPKYNIRELKSGEKRVKDKTKRELYTLISEKCGM